MSVRIILLSTCIFLVNHSLSAQKADSTVKKVKIVPLPALFYTPETRLGFGALLSGVFRAGDAATTRQSNAQLLAAYTLNKQIILQLKHTAFTKDERHLLSGEMSFFDFPILYYGVGNNSSADFEEDLEYKVFVFEQRALKKIGARSFAGFQYRFNYIYDLNYEPLFLSDRSRVLNEGGTNSGIGFSYLFDSRDNILNPLKGRYFEVSTFIHGKGLGGDYGFTKVGVDYRKYWSINKKDVLAAQIIGEFNFGNEVPFRELSQLGGDEILRGFYNGRFRDKDQVAAQVEYRKQIISWIGITGFAAVGDVSSSIGDFQLSEFKYALGGGLRFMVNQSDRLNIRIDYGIGKGTSGLYFGFTEAF